MFKRLFDIWGALLLLAVFALPMLAIALLIRLGSPGRAVFRQRRAGWRGKPFTMLKFRTMRAGVDPYGGSPHGQDDPRLTRFGRRLRELSLDELPQIFNVLAGDMSLVGPRPLYERQVLEWNERQRRRLEVKPGLTGYAQAFGRGQLTIEEKIEMDVHYVENPTLRLDLRILLRTLCGVFARRGEVYEQRYSLHKEFEEHPCR